MLCHVNSSDTSTPLHSNIFSRFLFLISAPPLFLPFSSPPSGTHGSSAYHTVPLRCPQRVKIVYYFLPRVDHLLPRLRFNFQPYATSVTPLFYRTLFFLYPFPKRNERRRESGAPLKSASSPSVLHSTPPAYITIIIILLLKIRGEALPRVQNHPVFVPEERSIGQVFFLCSHSLSEPRRQHPPTLRGRGQGMAKMTLRLSGLLLLVAGVLALPSEAATLALYNKCRETVWPGIQPSAGKPVLARGGFRLLPNQAYSVRLPPAWSGRVWGRQGCSFDSATGRGRCATGDCGGNLYCNGVGGAPPATLAEMTLGEGQAQDFYDVSLVDGYNIGISMTPFRGKAGGGGGRCAAAGCVSDLNAVCPSGLAVRDGSGGRVVACKSACSAFGSPRYCCTGSYGGPQQCKPTAYSRLFKTACPRAYSYAYDDPTSILTCTGASYLITFCPHH